KRAREHDSCIVSLTIMPVATRLARSIRPYQGRYDPPRTRGSYYGGSMQLRALRRGGLVLLALAAAAATMAEPASAATSAAAHRKSTLRRHHHHARGPRGVVYARNAIVVDPQTDKVLYTKNADVGTPIASLTKLMSAMVFLDRKPDLRRTAEVTQAEIT